MSHPTPQLRMAALTVVRAADLLRDTIHDDSRTYGYRTVATHLDLSLATVQRWRSDGPPVATQLRHLTADLDRWPCGLCNPPNTRHRSHEPYRCR